MWEAYKQNKKKINKKKCHHPFKIPKVCQVLTVAVVYTTSRFSTLFLVFHNVPCFPCKTLPFRNKLY